MNLNNSHVHRFHIARFMSVESDRDREIVGVMIDRELEAERTAREFQKEYRENLLEQLESSMMLMSKEDPADFNYILCLVVMKCKSPDVPYNRRQFKRLCKIHTKYCNGR